MSKIEKSAADSAEVPIENEIEGLPLKSLEDMPLQWRVHERVTVYNSAWIKVHRDTVELPDGTIIEGHHVLDFPRNAVGVVALNEEGQVMLIDHERFIPGFRDWELPAGGVEDGEEWEEAARRELREETGCTGGEYLYLGQHFPSSGSSNQLFVYYIARKVRQTEPIQDTSEINAARWFSVAEVRALIDGEHLHDGLTLTGLLLAFYKGFL